MITINVSTISGDPAIMRGSLDLRGLSTDTKPTENIPNGSTFIEINTGKVYIFNEAGAAWVEM